MRAVVSRARQGLATADRVTAYSRGGALALALVGFAALQWSLFEPRPAVQLVGLVLELVVVVAAVCGLVVVDGARDSPGIYWPTAAGLACLGVSATTETMAAVLVQTTVFTTVFENLAFVVALGALLLATSRWAEQRRAREADLERRNERLDNFASVASHDLRNPIQVAHGNLELVREEDDEEALDRLQGAIDRMDAIVDDVLQFSRVGAEYVDPEPIELTDAAEAAWDAIQTDSATMVPDGPTVEADPQMLQQALENLFRNALDHGGDDVTIWVGDSPRGFYVMDDGPGISSDERDDIFESGYSRGDGGTGFGLAIVERIVEAHGWSIQVITGHDAGARFEIRIE